MLPYIIVLKSPTPCISLYMLFCARLEILLKELFCHIYIWSQNLAATEQELDSFVPF
jgi:hypothetical protein